MKSSEEFDYIIVGAGSAGCVLAARLTECRKHRVALIEAGGEPKGFWFRPPLAYGKLYLAPENNWNYTSEPEPALNNTRSFQPRGKVLGGSGSINGMVYLRGQPEDFDHWRQLGNVGWSYRDVLPYFRMSEDNEWGETEYHGAGGPLRISTCAPHELGEAFVTAAEQAGYRRNPDLNGPSQEGFGHGQANIRNGERCSTYDAYLQPARTRPNLQIIKHALASRVLLHGRRAVGIEFRRDNAIETITARRDVILAGGTFNSPQLLQLSGIGPGELLHQHNIPVAVDLPGVGEHLEDHLGLNITYRCSQPITINDMVTNPIRRTLMGMNYVFFRKGMMATNGVAAQGFVRSDPALAAPDLMLRMRLFSRSRSTKSFGNLGLHPFPSFDIGPQLMHAESWGTVRIKSPDPTMAPALTYNSFTAERDHKAAIAGFRVVRKIMSMPAIQPYIAGELTQASTMNTDEDILDLWRKGAAAVGHPTSTCRMGVDDLAVVDPRLRVRGVDNLRVIDASIMPRCVGANTNATAIMIGEKGAAMVLEDAK